MKAEGKTVAAAVHRQSSVRYNSAVPEPTYNPYAPPRPEGPLPPNSLDASKPTTSGRAPGESLKWVYVSVAGLELVASLAGAAGASKAEHLARVLAFLDLVITSAWIFQSWNGIPQPFRDGVSPQGAIGRLFVPLYNAYWFFAVNVRLCVALDRALAAVQGARIEPRAPQALAFIAPCAQLVGSASVALLSVAPALQQQHPALRIAIQTTVAAVVDAIWFLYIFRCDEVRREVARTSPRADPLESFWPLLVGTLLLVLFFVAAWNFFSPPAPPQ